MNPVRALLVLVAAALLVLPGVFAPAPRACPAGLLGPIAELAAEIQWVRYEGALTRGEEARALALAESALALAPHVGAGWQRLAAHQGYDLASPALEPDLARRREWLAAAESTLERGAALVEQPAELVLFHALLLHSKAGLDPELAAGGADELYACSATALQRAVELGSHAARAMLASPRPTEAK
jgi:hypothetical protein